MKRVFGFILAFLFAVSIANAQRSAEVAISFNEQFFDTLLDAVFQNGMPPEFPLAQKSFNCRDAETQSELSGIKGMKGHSDSNVSLLFHSSLFQNSASPRLGGKKNECRESVRLLRESGGVRTAVRFRDGQIIAPLAFEGNYNPPLIGCIEFSGVAHTILDLEFDRNGRRLIGRARVTNVSINGSGGVGGGVIAKLVQSSIDKKVNPIEIFLMDKISFVVPIQNAGRLKMKTVGVRHEVKNGRLDVHILFEFSKG